jgi:manganese/iron transport system substrate-binding protein
MRHSLPRFSVLLLASLVLATCQSGDGAPSEVSGDRPRVVASTALIGEFASIVAGEDARVETLIPPGVDLHSFEPAPASAAAVARADIVFVNGYNLEEGLLDIVLQNVRGDAPVVAVAAGLLPIEGASADVAAAIRAEGDPHFWLNVAHAEHYVAQIEQHLAQLDPGHADAYEARAGAYIEQLRALDAEVRIAIEAIPQASRQLIVFHDAYRYFAAAYGLNLTASVLPVGAQQDPSAAALANLIELIEAQHVTAIYREPQFGASVLQSIADETGVAVLVLRSTFSDGVDSYVELMRANVAALVEGLSEALSAGDSPRTLL